MQKNNFIERLDWLIKKFGEGKPFVFAKKIGIKAGTFQSYLKGRLPQAEQLLCFRKTFGVNLNWLLTGYGEPIEHPQAQAVDTERAELLRMVCEILDSDGGYSVSLAANIRSFHEAVSTSRDLAVMKSEIAEIKKAIRATAGRTREGDPPEKKEELLQKRAISSG
jgi:hypothetical protein